MVIIQTMYKRNIEDKITEAIKDTPVIFLNGPRQAGKSTLMAMLQKKHKPASYVTFDDLAILEAASQDPLTFLESASTKHLIIDEVQKLPDLFPAMKLLVDRDRRPGRFLLTGSANILLLPQIAESLAGRTEILTLYPLSVGELQGKKETFIERVFSGEFQSENFEIDALCRLIHSGGFPEVIDRKNDARKKAWFRSYVDTILKRDVQNLAKIEGLTKLPNLLSLIGTYASGTIRYEDLSKSCQLPSTTLKRYLILLETFFLIHTLPAWSSNLGKRLVKAPKIYINDCGLLCYLLGLDLESVRPLTPDWGKLVETFVVNEVKKIATWSARPANLYYYRTYSKEEVDLVVESDRREVVGIEVKATKKLKSSDFKAMHRLKESAGDRFKRGVILYLGEQVLPFGPDMVAVPISNLWL